MSNTKGAKRPTGHRRNANGRRPNATDPVDERVILTEADRTGSADAESAPA